MTSALFMQHEVVIPYQHFGMAYWSYLQGSRSPRRRMVTLGNSLYMGKGVGGDWFSAHCQTKGLMQYEEMGGRREL